MITPAYDRLDDVPDAALSYREHALDTREADRLLADLLGTVAWEQHTVRMFGREVPCPRLSAWYGDGGASYRYSGRRYEPHPWIDELADLRDRLETDLGTPFNSVLANWYRDGRDSMGWHSDDEPELGPEPTIASISLGAERLFRLRHRHRKDLELSLALGHGSLLVMAGPTQRYWKHALPRSARVSEARVNLTFRRIVPQVPP